jgi:phenylacetate-CoA ligase
MAYREIAPVRQYQFVQHTLEDIEVRFVVDRPLTAAEEEQLGGVIHSALGHPFRLKFTYLAGEIPRSPSGKFEEFISRIEQG